MIFMEKEKPVNPEKNLEAQERILIPKPLNLMLLDEQGWDASNSKRNSKEI